jgi:O-antigen/teichoic acid export membrane protein
LLQNLVTLLRGVGYAPQLNAAYRYYPEAELAGSIHALRKIILRRLAKLLLFAVSPLAVMLASWCVWSGSTLWLVPVMVALVLADVGRQFELTLLSAARRQKIVAVLSVVENVARPLFIVALAYLFVGSTSLVLCGVCASLLLPAALLYLLGRAEGVERSPGTQVEVPSYSEEMQRYALGLAPYAALTWVVGVSDRYIIQWLGHSSSDVGIYSAAYALVSQPFIMAVAMLASGLRPVWFNAVTRGDEVRADRAFGIWMLAAVGIGTIGAVSLWLLSPWVAHTFLAPQYSDASKLMPWIAFGYLFFGIQQVLEVRLLAYKRTTSVVIVGAAGALLSIAVTIPMVLRFGMYGAAYACPLYLGGQCAVNGLLVFLDGRTRFYGRETGGL